MAQLADAAHLNPFDHEDVSSVIEACAVRADELSGSELVARLLANILPGVGGGIVAQLRDHVVVAVKQGHPRAEVRHHYVAVFINVEMARQVGATDESDMFARQREVLDTAVGAIGNGNDRLGAAHIADNPMRAG